MAYTHVYSSSTQTITLRPTILHGVITANPNGALATLELTDKDENIILAITVPAYSTITITNLNIATTGLKILDNPGNTTIIYS